MNDYAEACTDLDGAIIKAGGREALTVDQAFEVAKIRALISISQELSQIHHEGINPEFNSN